MTHWPGLSHFPPLIMIVIIKIVIIKIVIIIIIFIKRHNKIKRHKKIKRHLLNFKQKGLVKASIKAGPTLHLRTLPSKIPHHFQISPFSHILTIYPHLQNTYGQKLPLYFVHCSYRFYFHVKVTYVIFTAPFSLLSTLVNCHHGLFLNPFSKMHLTLLPSLATKAGNRAYNTVHSQKYAHTFNSLTQLYLNNVKRIQT